MSLSDLARDWDAFGRTDPLWAILTLPGKRHGGWTAEEFFATGRDEIARVVSYLDGLGRPPARRRALDFGCGVGRLTQALALHFDEVDGVDVSSAMVEKANAWNRHGARCRHHVNVEPHLALLPGGAFDLVYSAYVLQHMDPTHAEGYVKEFVRLLSPGGVALFQLTAEPRAGATAPLPREAFRAAITVEAGRRVTSAGALLEVPVRVENLGPCTWPARGDRTGRFRVTLGNHWREESGALVENDDGREALPEDLPSRGTVDLSISVTTPPRPGAYLLELDLVQEGVAWFADHGSGTIRVPVRVEAPPSPSESPAPRPRMEMHGAPPDLVSAWVRSAGGRLLGTAGPFATGHAFLERSWSSFTYCVDAGGTT